MGPLPIEDPQAPLAMPSRGREKIFRETYKHSLSNGEQERGWDSKAST